jgi:hypothetical protein
MDETPSISPKDRGLEPKHQLLIARPEHMTCQQEAMAYGTVRPFLDCIPMLRRELYPADLDGRSQPLASLPWVAPAHE